MRPGPIQTAAQYLGGLITAAFFVVLLTFIFSFLGTIFCAALAGMMLGALRTLKWQSIPVSLIFPVVIFTLLRGMKTDLAGRQILLLAVVCFSVFWVSYGVAAALFFVERKNPRSAVSASQDRAASTMPVTEPLVAPVAEGAVRNGSLNLEVLQGDWTGEATAGASYQNRRLSIQQERLTLSVADSSGQVKLLAKAQVRLCTLGSLPTLLVAENGTETSADTLVCI